MPRLKDSSGKVIKFVYIHIKVPTQQKKFLDAQRKRTGIGTSEHVRTLVQREMSVMKEV